MPAGQQITLDTAYGSYTVARTLAAPFNTNLEVGFDLAILINAGRDIVLPGPEIQQVSLGFPGQPAIPGDFDETDFSPVDFSTGRSGSFPSSDAVFNLIPSVPHVIVTPPGATTDIVLVGTVVGTNLDQCLLNVATPIGVVESGTLVLARMPTLTAGGLYRAYLRFGTVSTAYAFFFVNG